jgi:hypothetical protein
MKPKRVERNERWDVSEEVEKSPAAELQEEALAWRWLLVGSPAG